MIDTIEISEQDLNVWADYILNHSLGGIDPQDVVMIKGERIVWPLMSILQDKIFAAGAIADINLVAPDNNRGQVWGASMAKHGKVEQIQRTPQWHQARYDAMTKYIEILGAENPALFANLPDDTAAEISKADYPFKQIRMAKPWILTLYPTAGFADMEGLPLDKYTEIIVKASTTNPKMLEDVEKPIAQLMEKAHRVRIETQHPKSGKLLALEMDITDRKPVLCTGKRNFPDGEVFTSPNANSASGEIFVDLPVFYNGVTIEGIYLEMKEGKIINYNAEKEFETLKKIIETDDGSHRIGEVALGMNRGLQTALKHPLFVEKVGGTLHIAIGESYGEPYGIDPSTDEGKALLREFIDKGIYNKSSQHVDIVTDFRPGGAGRAVYLDNTKLKIKDNIWVV
ncbi:MAG: aminopeptidase [Candidatus Aminicenantes bacterium]|nr:aminopeptidase [Candidatus Aminicenantes bacterium]